MNDYRRFLTFVFLLMISGSAALAQELMKVAGLVVDQNADPLIGVTVRVQGDNKGGTVLIWMVTLQSRCKKVRPLSSLILAIRIKRY